MHIITSGPTPGSQRQPLRNGWFKKDTTVLFTRRHFNLLLRKKWGSVILCQSAMIGHIFFMVCNIYVRALRSFVYVCKQIQWVVGEMKFIQEQNIMTICKSSAYQYRYVYFDLNLMGNTLLIYHEHKAQ